MLNLKLGIPTTEIKSFVRGVFVNGDAQAKTKKLTNASTATSAFRAVRYNSESAQRVTITIE